MEATLYALALSHPAHAARRMLEHKGIEHRVVTIPPGFHPPLLRIRGFPRGTVPALRVGGRRIQGSLEISRALERLRPEPPLFPAGPAGRAVEDAERWGEAELQPVPRRLFRWQVANDLRARTWVAREHVPLPGAALLARPPLQARLFARAVGADDAAVQADLAALPALLDRVDALRGDGVLDAGPLNAADLQIASSVAALASFPQVAERLGDHPAVAYARRLFPAFPAGPPPALPEQWLP